MAITWSPIDKSNYITLSNGNLTAYSTVTNWQIARATEGKTSGKWYFEFKAEKVLSNGLGIGIMDSATVCTNNYPSTGKADLFLCDGTKWGGGGGSIPSYGTAWTANDIIGVLIDLDTSGGQISFKVNNVDKGIAFTNILSGYSPVFAAIMIYYNGSTGGTVNFGATPFTYSIPSGYMAYEPQFKYLLQQGSNIYSIKASDYSKIGQTPINRQQFIDYGVDDKSIINIPQSVNTSHGIDKGALGSGKYFSNPFNSNYKTINKIQ